MWEIVFKGIGDWVKLGAIIGGIFLGITILRILMSKIHGKLP